MVVPGLKDKRRRVAEAARKEHSRNVEWRDGYLHFADGNKARVPFSPYLPNTGIVRRADRHRGVSPTRYQAHQPSF